MTESQRKAFDAALAAMSDLEVLHLMETAALESDEFELAAGEAERRNIEN